jgi:hypothetical protein
MCEFRLPRKCKWDLQSSEMLLSVGCYLVTDVSGQFIRPIVKCEAVIDYSWTACLMEPIDCPEISVRNYHSMLSKIPKQHRHQLQIHVALHPRRAKISIITALLKYLYNITIIWPLQHYRTEHEGNRTVININIELYIKSCIIFILVYSGSAHLPFNYRVSPCKKKSAKSSLTCMSRISEFVFS